MTERLLEALYRHSLVVKANKQQREIQSFATQIQRIQVNNLEKEQSTQLQKLKTKKIKLEQEYAKTLSQMNDMGMSGK